MVEFKRLLPAFVKAAEFVPVEGPAGEVEDVWAGSLQPFVVGRREEGIKLPVKFRPLRA